MKVINVMLSADAHRALELLEDYHSQLTNVADRPLRSAIERVIRIFKSRLFQALLGNLYSSCALCSAFYAAAIMSVCLVCILHLTVVVSALLSNFFMA